MSCPCRQGRRERDRVLLDRIEIRALAERLGLDGLALGRDAHDVARKLLDLLLPALAHEAEDVAHVLLADLLALGASDSSPAMAFSA